MREELLENGRVDSVAEKELPCDPRCPILPIRYLSENNLKQRVTQPEERMLEVSFQG